MNEYLIKVTTKQSLKTVTKHIEKKFKLKDYTYDRKTQEANPATYVYQLSKRGCGRLGLNKNMECLRDRLNDSSRKTGSLYFNSGDSEVEIRLNSEHSEDELPNLLIANKLNGSAPITMYSRGFDFEIKDYSIKLAEMY
tara:strand:+ start:535 stop:951 length:417 start_codon:yes stop_codon:yes gene_type:complete